MRRYLIFTCFMLCGLTLSFSQSVKVIDDIYITPNDAQMINEVQTAKKTKKAQENSQSAVYRNGAREIVFIDQYGNRTTAVSDTVYIIDGEVIADSVSTDELDEEGYYLNEFNGSKSDYEYAERIRRFHNPRYTITIADPGYNDIYFLDDSYWNVYVDGMYATITPTWTNPYWWNYQFAPYSYSSWAWRMNWGYPYYSWGGSYGWGYPYYGGYYGWYDPWFSGYYGWGGYYGWDYPYYGGWGGYPYYSGGWYETTNQSSRRPYSGGERFVAGSDNSGRRTATESSRAAVSGTRATSSGRSAYTTVGRQSTASRGDRAVNSRTSGTRTAETRSTYSPDVNSRTRTGSVRSSGDWNNVRNNSGVNTNSRTYSTSTERNSSAVNRSASTSRSTPVTNSSRQSSSTRQSNSSYTPSSSYNSSSSSSRNSSSYSSGSSSRSSSSGYSSGGSRSSSSGGSRSSSGGRR